MEVVGERYRLDAELGTGGTATVWLAHDLHADRTCAVKLLLPVESGAESRRERMHAEARVLTALDHPNVVRVYDVGEHLGRDFIVMEYLESGSLADRLAREGTLAPAEATRIVLEVLDALSAAHAAGIVHRDVKPGNALLREDGGVVLCDFGIARTDTGSDTHTGVALGSLGYMAPEQRIDARRVGPQADLYAAACTLFNLLTGDTPVDLYLAPDHSPRWDPIPVPLRPVLRRATRSEPSARFETASEMADALRKILPAIEALPAARPKKRETPVGYVRTRTDAEPSPLAEQRVRHVDADDWGWSTQHRPVGRNALWLGVAIIVLFSSTLFALGPMADRFQPVPQAPAPTPEQLPPQPVAGRWSGTFGANRAHVDLRGPPEALEGTITLQAGPGRSTLEVAGQWNPITRELMLHDLTGPGRALYVARLSESGLVLEGRRMQRDEAWIEFALTRDPE